MFLSSLNKNASFYTSTLAGSSMLAMLNSNKTDLKPLVQQIDLHLQDIEIQPRSIQKPPTGTVIVYFPDTPGFEVDFYSRESVKSLRTRIEKLTKLPMNEYTLACKSGTMLDDKGLDEYNIVPQSNIIVFEKGAQMKIQKKAREGWLESRKTRIAGVKSTNLNFLKEISTTKRPKIMIKPKQKQLATCPSVETFLNQMSSDFF